MTARRGLFGIASLIALILTVALGAYVWLDTKSGHRFITSKLGSYEFENGIKIRVARIEGSIYGETRVVGLTFADAKGVFASAKRVDITWNPWSLLNSRVQVRNLIIPEARMARIPLLKVVPPNDEPLLPDIDINIDNFALDRFVIEPAVTGKAHLLAMNGRVNVGDRRAQIEATANALVGPGLSGGDKLTFVIDAVPDENRLTLRANLNAPADGVLASYTNIALPTQMNLDGSGSWKSWKGQFTAKVDDKPMADLALTANDGTFSAKGTAEFAGLLTDGPGQDLLTPTASIDVAASLDERRAVVRATFGNSNFTASVNGLVDMAASQFGDLNIDFRLLPNALLAQNLTGKGVTASIVLNGSFGRPQMAYRINAARVGLAEIILEGLRASGTATFDTDRMIVPVSATVQRVTGLNAAAGGLLNNVRLNGDLAYANGRILSDNMKIRSDRIDATAILVANVNSGLYTGALKGRVNDYSVDGIGIFNVETNVDLKTKARGFLLSGTVRARSTRLFNDTAREFLGGNALISANVSYGSDGVVRVTRINLASPQFRVTSGQGSYTADGGIRFAGGGYSNQYGPLKLSLSGSLGAPVAKIFASRPGLGIGLVNVSATIRSNRNGYGIIAQGQSDYGPFAADLVLLSGRGLTTIDIGKANYAGVDLSGRLQQSAAGPFVGRLSANGSGVEGFVELAAVGKTQRAIIDVTARNAVYSGPASLSIGRAIVDADIIFYDQPQITADVQLADTRSGALTLAVARGKIDYRGGRGNARLLAEGRNGVPFRIAANVALTPAYWRVALAGRANSIDFKTRQPARIIPGKGMYRLDPTTIDLSKGSIQLAGDYGRGLNVQSRLTDVDLAILNPIYSGLGLGGTATGSLDFAQSSPDAFPQADARLTISNFTRSSMAAISRPVDINIVGRLLPNGGNMRAIVRRRGTVIGRVQADLTPLPPTAGDWTTRLWAAPLSGGVRYNGPAETLFSLVALPDQSLKGALGIAADFSGRVQSPQLSGVVRATNLVYENSTYGTKLTQVKLRGTFTNDQLTVEEISAKAGKGTVTGKGFVSLSSAKDFPVQLQLDLQNARVANNSDLATSATGTLNIVHGPNQLPTISGTLSLPETRYRIVRQGAVKVATLTGVRRKIRAGPVRVAGNADPISGLPTNWKLDIDVVADEKLYVTGMGLDSEWSARLKFTGVAGAPIIEGQIDLIRGTLGFAGKSFALESGRVNFEGTAINNPLLRVVASGNADGIVTNVTITGRAYDPQISFSSIPNLPQDEIIARILFGNSIAELSALQAVQLASSLNALRGGSGGLNPLGVLQSASGIDRLRLLGPDDSTGRGNAVAVGKYISNDIYVEIVTDARGYTASQIEIALTPALSVLSQVGSFGGSNINVRYRKDY